MEMAMTIEIANKMEIPMEMAMIIKTAIIMLPVIVADRQDRVVMTQIPLLLYNA